MKRKEAGNTNLISATLSSITLNRMSRYCWLCFCIAGCWIIWTGCKKEENFSSSIIFLNGTLGGPAISMRLDSNVVFSNIRPDSLVNRTSPSGTFLFRFDTLGNTSPALSFTTNLQAGYSYTGILYDTASQPKLFLRRDVFPAAPGSGRCAIRVFNLITGSTGTYMANDTNKTYLSSRVYSFADFASGASSPDFIETDTLAKPSFRIDSLHFVARVPNPLESGKIYSLYLVGNINDTLRINGNHGTYQPKVIIQVHN